MRYRTIISSAALVIAIHIFGSMVNLYNRWIPFDMLMHFLGGVVAAMVAVKLIGWTKANHPKWFEALFVLGFTLIIGLLWEYMEFGLDFLLGDDYRWVRMTLRDSLADLGFDSLGGLLFYYINKFKKN